MSQPYTHFFPALFATCSIVLAGCTESQENVEQTAQQVPAYRVNAKELYDEYKANEVAADQKYKGKVVIVAGTVKDIRKDLMDRPYILIGESELLGIRCTFVSKDSSPIAHLQKGQRVSVKGKVSGKVMDVMLKECSLQ
jgi:hypothetical protein